MAKMIFVSLPVTDLQASIAFSFYKALGFQFWMDPAAIPPSDGQS